MGMLPGNAGTGDPSARTGPRSAIVPGVINSCAGNNAKLSLEIKPSFLL